MPDMRLVDSLKAAAPARLPKSESAPPFRVPPPRLYLYFSAIARHGSIRSAANELRIASSALNRRLLDLERDLGTVLFDRLRTGVRLTPAGEIFAAHAQRTLADAEWVGEEIQNLSGRIGGMVVIGSAESAAIDLLPSLMSAFQQENAGVRFTVLVTDPSAMLADLLDDRVHLILTHETPNHADVLVISVVRKTFCVLMRASHPLADASSLSMQECHGFPVVLAAAPLAARALIETTFAATSLQVQPALVTNMFEVMKNYVTKTDALSFQFHFGPTCLVDDNGLIAIPLSNAQVAQAHLTLAVRRGRALSPSVSAFCERISDALGQP